MQVQPYLFFNGRCDEAMEFYRSAIGAEIITRMSFGESPEPPPPGMVGSDAEKKVMHASFRIGKSELFASDGCDFSNKPAQGVSLSLSVETDAQAKRMFEALASGGQVTMPLNKTFFASSFGMVKDRFGIEWMVIADQI